MSEHLIWKTIRRALMGSTLIFAAHGASGADLTVNIKNLRGQTGMVYVALFENAENFPKSDKSVAGQYLAAHGGSTSVVFLNLKPGRYAISTYQDENGNGKLDSNLLGVPLEPYGFSRDASGTMGPPSFDAAAVDLSGNLAIDINLH